MELTLTAHAKFDRRQRIEALEQVLGFTRSVLEVKVQEEDRKYCLTSSGVLLVKSISTDVVITAFMANIDQCYRLYRMAGKKQISPKVRERVMKNAERHWYLFDL